VTINQPEGGTFEVYLTNSSFSTLEEARASGVACFVSLYDDDAVVAAVCNSYGSRLWIADASLAVANEVFEICDVKIHAVVPWGAAESEVRTELAAAPLARGDTCVDQST
jgi:hypothetical protein